MRTWAIIPLSFVAVACGHADGPRVAGAPEHAATPDVQREHLRHRAVEAVLWGMPAVNRDVMYQAMLRETEARDNQLLYWSGPLEWTNQTLTPNTDVIYLTPYFDTKDVGPIVVEIPPAGEGVLNGTIMDTWQMPLEDVGPAGADRGAGGKYLILPPGHTGEAPSGYVVLPSPTYRGYALLRSIPQGGSDEDLARAVEYGKRIRIYPLSQAEDPPPTVFVDAAGVPYDATIPYDHRFFESLNRVVQHEPWLERDRVMIDVLRSIGIEKGKAFAPDAETVRALDDAGAHAHALLDAMYEEVVTSGPFAAGSRWAFPASIGEVFAAGQAQYAAPDDYPVASRGLLFSFIFWMPKRLGEGQFYLMAIQDAEGDPLEGNQQYRLTVPPNAPVRQYWSATLYDRDSHALIREVSHAARSSLSPGLQTNADGSVDLYFGPEAPAGKESNWTPTNPDRGFEILFRFYGPLPPLFDKSWVLPDVERVR